MRLIKGRLGVIINKRGTLSSKTSCRVYKKILDIQDLEKVIMDFTWASRFGIRKY